MAGRLALWLAPARVRRLLDLRRIGAERSLVLRHTLRRDRRAIGVPSMTDGRARETVGDGERIARARLLRPLRFLLDELDLDEAQRKAARGIVRDLRRSLRRAYLARLGEVAGAFGDETFDRPRVEGLIGRGRTPLPKSAEALVDGLEKLHAILTAEQRGRLRSLFAVEGGPYRA